jgi:hypothetical protein
VVVVVVVLPRRQLGTSGGFLVRLCDLVGAPRGRNGLFFCLPGRGVHLGGASSKWGGRVRPVGHAAGGAPGGGSGAGLCHWPGRGGRFFLRGVTSEISGWIERAGSARPGPANFKKGTAVLGKYGLETAHMRSYRALV